MNKLKNILSFFLQLLVLPIARQFAVFAVDGTELGKIFYQNACFLFMLCYAIRKPVLSRTFKPEGRLSIGRPSSPFIAFRFTFSD